MRVTKKFKESKASTDFCKDVISNFVFLIFSLVPITIALYFIREITQYIDKPGDWLSLCDEGERDSIINRLEWNRIYYVTLAGATILRLP